MDDIKYYKIIPDLAGMLNVEINVSNEDACEINDVPLRKRQRNNIDGVDDSDSSNNWVIDSENEESSKIWSAPMGNQRDITHFTEISGFPPSLRYNMSNKSPYEFFELMVTDEIFQEIVDCTNEFANHKTAESNKDIKFARIRKWTPTNIVEIKKFFGLIIFMGIIKLPRITDYWSTDEVIGHPYPRTIMSRNRFELLLQTLYFSREYEICKSNMLQRIDNLLKMLNTNYQKYYIPTEELYIDESVVPFRGRMVLRQKNLLNRHRYGIKEFKLCSFLGYTYRINLYASINGNTSPINVAMDLCKDVLNKGRTLYTDDWFTSINLARKLLDNETHLVGTLRKNRKNIPKSVLLSKLQKGKHIARESSDGITIIKWKDERDILVLSTKHSDGFHSVIIRGKLVSKPQIIIDYNKRKEAIKLSDQMASYSTPLRKSVKWFRKLAIDLLLNTSIVNAFTLYKTVTKNSILIVDFRRQILKHLCNKTEDVGEQRPKKHVLARKEGPTKVGRRTCQICYKEKAAAIGAKLAKNKSKKVVTYCATCPNKPWLCLDCFNKTHS